MAHELDATTANVLIGFQTHPGVDTKSLITVGNATITGAVKPVKPQGSGYYCLKLADGATAELNLFGTKYMVKMEAEEKKEARQDFLITGWKVLGRKTRRSGKQRRLQLLGYYTGIVDGKKGRKSERAALNFQADNALRNDGEIGNRTKTKLDTIIDDNNKVGTRYIIRKTLIRFTRAPSKDDPKKWVGNPNSNAPDIDDRGFIEVKTYEDDMTGPVVTAKRDNKFRVKVIRDFIDKNATLIAVSSDEKAVKVLTKTLAKKKHMILELEAQKLERVSKKTATISIKYKQGDKEYVIGNLQVLVLSNITRLVRPVWVTINGTAPGTANDKTNYSNAFRVVNRVWRHSGIYFHFLSWHTKTLTNLTTAGQLTNVEYDPVGKPGKRSHKLEFNKFSNAKNDSNRVTEQNKINVYIVKKIDGAYGITYDAIDYGWPNGIALCKNGNWVRTGIDLAHELGHFLGMANCYPGNSHVHAEDDPDSSHKKKDIWSIRRLMYGGWPKTDRPGDGWAHNVGYGNGQYGCLVSVRNLPKDKTDNELLNGRNHMVSNKFYKK